MSDLPSTAGLRVLAILFWLVVTIPVGLWIYLADHDVPPPWICVSLVIGWPTLFLTMGLVGAYVLPPQRPGVGFFYVMRHWL